ncbi:MAG: TonB family protein [Betaproteobacteria bacterium]|nr:TonB family protein [Betaproteobacteria bacterium]
MIRSCAASVLLLLSLSAPAANTGFVASTLPRLLTPEQHARAELGDYASAVLRRVGEDQAYPAEALDHEWEGTVRVNMLIGADGQVKTVHVSRSSGHRALDDEAVRKVRALHELPTPPSVLQGREFHLAIPVRFVLE